jgi:hypothetical protein
VELPLQPGHPLRWQGGTVQLLQRRLQQRPDTQQPGRVFDPEGRAAVGGFADNDDKMPYRPGSLVIPRPRGRGFCRFHTTRLAIADARP